MRPEETVLILAAAGLLLQEPDGHLTGVLRQRGVDVPPGEIRQTFYDRLVMPQSAAFLPPFEHVFRQGKRVSGIWHFPPARPDGAVAVERLYARFGFDPTRLDICPLLRFPHIPGDHLGFLLTFAVLLREAGETELLSRFASRHLDGWVETWCQLLPVGDKSGYLAQVARGVKEAVALLRLEAAAVACS